MSPPPRETLAVTEMANGGAAIGRAPDGAVVCVEDALPGETVVAELSEQRRRFRRARAVEVVEAAPGRTAPPCPYVPECGGCQLQHADYELQLRLKAAVLRETLRRGGASAPEAELVPAAEPFRYRIRGEFHVLPPAAGGGHRLGFNRRRSYDAVAVDDCLIHHDHIAGALGGICRALDDAGAGTMRALRLTVSPERPELLWRAVGGAAPPGMQEALAAALPGYLVQGDSLTLEYDRALIDGGPGRLMFRVDSESFVQVNHKQAHNLYGKALVYLGERPGRLLELYAGLGMLSILAATRPDPATRPGRATLVESSSAAAVLGRLHLRLHEVGDFAAYVAGDAEGVLARIEPGEVDSVIVDPPRAGLGAAVVNAIARLQPERVVYVSCDPATLARDLALFHAGGFNAEAQALVDMFPQTYHIETVTLLSPGPA